MDTAGMVKVEDWLFPGTTCRVSPSSTCWEGSWRDQGKIDADGLVLRDVVPSGRGGARGVVAGYSDLSGSWRAVAGAAEWPFGEDRVAVDSMATWLFPGRFPLAGFLTGRVLSLPRVPSLAEADQWVAGLDLDCPPYSCNCGKVHFAGGKVVGFSCMPGQGGVKSWPRLVVEIARGRYRESLLQDVLGLFPALVLECVSPGGPSVDDWNRAGGRPS